MSKLPVLGEYCIGTKWPDGDPMDPYIIGVYKEKFNNGLVPVDDHYVIEYIDKNTKNHVIIFYACHIEKISIEKALIILSILNTDFTYTGGMSIWWLTRQNLEHLKVIREKYS